MAILTIDKLNFSYPGPDKTKRVFSELSLTVSDGEFVAVVGPSGCGKTTLLLIIAGFLEVPAESITRSAGFTRPAMVFQAGSLFPWMSTSDNIGFPLRLQKMSNEQRDLRRNELIRLARLDGQASLYPAQLSQGMQQRAELARAWATNVKLILLDEALSSLDYPLRCEVQRDLETLWRFENRTVILVTHDPEEACFLADRVLVLSNEGTLQEIAVRFDRPRRDELRFHPAFLALRREVTCAIK